MKVVNGIWVLLFALVLAGCTAKQEESVIRIGLMADTISIPYCIAYEKGYFDAEGVKVEIQYFKSAQERDSAVQAGQLDGISSDMVNLLLLKNAGKDYRAVCSTDGVYKIVANGNVDMLKDMGDKKIGISSSTIMEYSVDQVMAICEVEKFEKVNIPAIPARVEMLNAGQIDAAIMPEPFASMAVAAGNQELADIKDYGLEPGVFLFQNDFVKGNMDKLKKFYAAYNKAAEYVNTTARSEYADMAAEKIGFDKEVLLSMELPTFRVLTLPDKTNLEKANSWLVEKKIMEKEFTYEDLVAAIQ